MSKSISSIKTSDTKEPSLDNPIYKVKQLINGSINTIYVFNGKKTEENEELFKKVFTEEERQQIESDKRIHYIHKMIISFLYNNKMEKVLINVNPLTFS